MIKITDFTTKNFDFDTFKIENRFYVYKTYSLQINNIFLKKGFSMLDNHPIIQTYKYDMLSRLLDSDYLEGHLQYEVKDGTIEGVEPSNKVTAKHNTTISYIIADLPFSDSLNSDNKNFDAKKVLELPQNELNKFELDDYGDNFYTELAKVDEYNINNIVNFIKTWGLPTGVSSQVLPSVSQINDINLFIMPIDLFLTKIQEYKKIFNYFEAINTDDFSRIRIPDLHPDSDFDADKDMGLHTFVSLETELMYKNDFNFKLTMKEEGLVPTILFKDMFEFAYFYLFRAFYDKEETRVCENCGHLFQIRHQRQRFCSPLPFRKRSSCEMAFNNRRKKKKD